MTAEDILFHSFALASVVGALLMVFVRNPIYSSLFLALVMSIMGALFFVLDAYFVSVAQITVYAGAVMVLFVLVMMLFDLKHESEHLWKLTPLTVIKIFSVALVCAFFIGTGWLAVHFASDKPAAAAVSQVMKKDNVPGQSGSVSAPEDEDLTTAEASALVDKPKVGSTVDLSRRLFSKYVFAFEAVSLLLLVAIVGAVALARSKGGTHHVA